MDVRQKRDVNRSSGLIRFNRFEIHYRVYGELTPDTQPIICLNGVQQTMVSWVSVVNYFKTRKPLIIFDFPSQGRSKILQGSDHVNLAEQSSILAALIDVLGLKEQLYFCAASWGSVIAAHYAAQNSYRIKRMLLCGFSARANTAVLDISHRSLKAIHSGDYSLIGQIIIDGIGQGLPLPLRKQILSQFREADQAQIRTLREHLDWTLSADLFQIINFRKIQTETVILVGEQDPIIDFESLANVASMMPKCQIKKVANVSHFLHFEDMSILSTYQELLFSDDLFL